MLKILRYEYIIFLMLLPFISIAEAEVIYNKKEGRLSVDVVNTPLTDVLRVISEKTGIIIKMDSGVDNSVTVGFNNLPVEEGIREIIRPNSYAMTFKKEVMENGRKDYFVETIYVLREGASGIANAALNGAQIGAGKVGSNLHCSQSHRAVPTKTTSTGLGQSPPFSFSSPIPNFL